MRFIILENTEHITSQSFLTEEFALGVKELLLLLGGKKIATIKMLRTLQYQQARFNATAVGRQFNDLPEHVLCLKDAKDIVEEVAKNYSIVLV
jgi:hypothetical protein